MSCMCSLNDKSFVFVNDSLTYGQFRDKGCMNKSTEHVTNLTEEDYEIILGCKPTTQRGHRILLIFNWLTNETPNCTLNMEKPYYWGSMPRQNRTCVSGMPLTSANDRPSNRKCQVATIFPGYCMDPLYNMNWTRCNETHPYICRQTGPPTTVIPECERVMTPTTNTNQQEENSILPGIATGVAVAVFSFILIGLILYCYCSKKRKKRFVESSNTLHQDIRCRLVNYWAMNTNGLQSIVYNVITKGKRDFHRNNMFSFFFLLFVDQAS